MCGMRASDPRRFRLFYLTVDARESVGGVSMSAVFSLYAFNKKGAKSGCGTTAITRSSRTSISWNTNGSVGGANSSS